MDAGNLTLDKVKEASEKIRARGPFPRSIWFIDRVIKYYQFCSFAGPGFFDVGVPKEGRIYYYTGMPVHNVTTSEIAGLPDLPNFKDKPGIWVEMSDGNHYNLDGRPDLE